MSGSVCDVVRFHCEDWHYCDLLGTGLPTRFPDFPAIQKSSAWLPAGCRLPFQLSGFGCDFEVAAKVDYSLYCSKIHDARIGIYVVFNVSENVLCW